MRSTYQKSYANISIRSSFSYKIKNSVPFKPKNVFQIRNPARVSSSSDDNKDQIIWKRREDVFEGVDDDFEAEDVDSIDVYKPKLSSKRPKSALVSGSKQTMKKFEPTKIEPFAMSMREEQKIRDKMVMAQLMGQDQAKQEAVDYSDNCSEGLVEFKAKPVPKHVYQPVFQEMMESQPKR